MVTGVGGNQRRRAGRKCTVVTVPLARTPAHALGSHAEPTCSVFSPQIARAAAASSLVYVVASVMASVLAAQRLRMAVAVHVTGCISVSAACVVLGCGTNALAPTGGGSLT